MTNHQIAREITDRWIRGREGALYGVGEVAWIELDDTVTAALDAKDATIARLVEALAEMCHAAHADDDDSGLAARVKARLPDLDALLREIGGTDG